jgi:TPR repeat protein
MSDETSQFYSQAEQARDRGDYKAALSLYLKATEGGDYYGAIRIAQMYCRGDGLTKDTREAARWMSKAAEIGGASAMYEVASYYAKGIQDVPQDFNEAQKWMHKAAELGHNHAMWRLAELYEDGLGVEQNQEQAIHWYRKAAAGPLGAAGTGMAKIALARITGVQENDPGSPEAQAKACFIATAACGSPAHPDVKILRDYRDRVLVPHALGGTVIRVYQRVSPPIAAAIRSRPWARTLVRGTIVGPLARWARSRTRPMNDQDIR